MIEVLTSEVITNPLITPALPVMVRVRSTA